MREAMRGLSQEQLEAVKAHALVALEGPRRRGESRNRERTWSVSGTMPSSIGSGRWEAARKAQERLDAMSVVDRVRLAE